MSSATLSAEQRAQAKVLAQAIHEAAAADIEELACNLVATDDHHPFGANEFTIRDLAHKIAATAIAQYLAKTKMATTAPA
jgi:hypothetical protein